MGKIYCIMGKSSTGKDTLFKKILGDESLSLKTIVPYTTRPVRAGEKNGVEYFFCDEKKVEELEREGRIIELRAYDTIHGIWKYFTVNDDQIDLGRFINTDGKRHQIAFFRAVLADALQINETFNITAFGQQPDQRFGLNLIFLFDLQNRMRAEIKA